jgi:hypothetical protein
MNEQPRCEARFLEGRRLRKCRRAGVVHVQAIGKRLCLAHAKLFDLGRLP